MIDTTVLVLMGGPDAEREVSLRSGAMVATALREVGRYAVNEQVVGDLTLTQLRALEGDVIFPVLHGPFGEGGPLQEFMEADGRPYIGSRPRAARIAMDKISSKLFARAAGIRTAPARILVAGVECELVAPVVVKPVDDGSSVGVRRCMDHGQFVAARAELEGKFPRLMAEKLITGREITVGILERELLPMIEVVTSQEFYDYSAKYERADTQYILDPILPDEVKQEIAHASRVIYERIGCRDLARVDFMVDEAGAWFLEINSMPGLTDHSLIPKAAAHAGITLAKMCERLVERSITRMKGVQRRVQPTGATATEADSQSTDDSSSQQIANDVGTATLVEENRTQQDQSNE